MKFFVGKETLETVRVDLREIVENMNSCDMKLHNKMMDRFWIEIFLIEDRSYLLSS